MTDTLWIMLALVVVVLLALLVGIWAFRKGVVEGSAPFTDQGALLEILAAGPYMLLPNSRGQWCVTTVEGKLVLAGHDPLDALKGLREHYHRLPDPPQS